MVRLRLAALLTAALVAVGAAPGVAAQSVPAIAVIVHDDVPSASVDAASLRRVYLMRSRLWPGGAHIAPVNLPAGSPLRESFSRLVLGAGSRDLAGYWNDLYFHGTQPPPTLASEQAVVLYVARTPGAVGYVSPEAAGSLPPGAHLALTLPPPA